MNSLVLGTKTTLNLCPVLWTPYDFFPDPDPTFLLVSDPAPDPDPVWDPTRVFF